MNDGCRLQAEDARKRKTPSDPLRKALIVSLTLHLGIVLAAVTGLPWLTPVLKPNREQPIVVDLVVRGETTKTSAPAKKDPSKPAPSKPAPSKPDPSKPAPSKPAPSKPDPSKPDPSKPAASGLDAAPTPPRPESQALKPVKPEQKSAPPKAEGDPFASLLQNVERFRQEKSVASETAASARGSDAPAADEATLSDIDAFRAQIEKNWTFDPGMKDVTTMEIVLRVLVNRDGSVAAVRFEDMGRYNSDPRYRVLADSARRAVEKSQPLVYPPEKYDVFRDVVLSFRPKDRL